MHRQLIWAAALALNAACAGPQYDTGQPAQQTVSDSIFVQAFNDNFYDARVHAVYTGGQRRSVGTIAGNGGHTSTALPWEPHALVFEVSFIISGADYVSLPVVVARGESLEVRLPANIDQSGFFRRVPRTNGGDSGKAH